MGVTRRLVFAALCGLLLTPGFARAGPISYAAYGEVVLDDGHHTAVPGAQVSATFTFIYQDSSTASAVYTATSSTLGGWNIYVTPPTLNGHWPVACQVKVTNCTLTGYTFERGGYGTTNQGPSDPPVSIATGFSFMTRN